MMSVLAHRFEGDRLMVIVPDRLSDLIAKGEITARYYNPGELFKEVHLVFTNDDNPPLEALQQTVGDAKLYVHNMPPDSRFFIRTLGWQPALMGAWTKRMMQLAQSVKPNLIRCHGADLNAHAAAAIRQALNIPYVVSFHINPAQSAIVWPGGTKQKIYNFFADRLACRGLRAADLVLPVYKSIIPYLEDAGVKRYRVAYNVLGAGARSKNNFELSSPVRIISVGRLVVGKNPENIIRALARLPMVHLTVVGTGPLRDYLIDVASKAGVSDRCDFVKSISNKDLCDTLGQYDIFASHCDYWGLPKAVMEPLLTGLPVVMNRREGEPFAELDELAMLVDNSAEGYEEAFGQLIASEEQRRTLGESARSKAEKLFGAVSSETSYVEIYRGLLSRGTAASAAQ
ncbi:glycosyltransferase [Bradyrhizobium sp.]|uniref:glycosyltransferase n=1 Tax=Bradyrhizobium sp. TaxID=376 RepID=UPI003C7748C6